MQVVAELPALYLPPSDFVVTPVLAWWRAALAGPRRRPGRGRAGACGCRCAELTDPANRFTVRTRAASSARRSTVAGLLVWGFTAGLLAEVLDLAGLDRDWDTTDRRPLPERLVELAGRCPELRRTVGGSGR